MTSATCAVTEHNIPHSLEYLKKHASMCQLPGDMAVDSYTSPDESIVLLA